MVTIMIEINYKKDCQCDSTSSGPRLYSQVETVNVKDHEVVYKLHGGYAYMVCDSCEKPWIRLLEENKNEEINPS